MENEIKITAMQFPEDKQEIAKWEEEFGSKPEFLSITHFILEDNVFYGLDEVIETNYEIIPIGEDEKKLAFVAKNEDNKIIAWLLMDVFDLTTEEPNLFLQYVVLHPEFQNKGYGTKVLNELFTNIENYVGVKPKKTFCYVHKKNIASRKLFEKFNFNSRECTDTYLKVQAKEPKLVSTLSSGELDK